ncbi:MAG: hypothetical protein AAGA09_04185 [Pseudomonadota bacterium]
MDLEIAEHQSKMVRVADRLEAAGDREGRDTIDDAVRIINHYDARLREARKVIRQIQRLIADQEK